MPLYCSVNRISTSRFTLFVILSTELKPFVHAELFCETCCDAKNRCFFDRLNQAVKLIHLHNLLRSQEPISDQATPTQQSAEQSELSSSSESDSSSDSADSDSEQTHLETIRVRTNVGMYSAGEPYI